MISLDAFIQFVIDLLSNYPQAPGKLIIVGRVSLPNPSAIGDMRSYIGDKLCNVLLQYSYYLVKRLCKPDYLVVLDVHEGYKEHVGYHSKVLYYYDENTGKIIEREFDETPIDSDFSLTSEELDDILSKF
jgi:hypothetical protein